MAYAQRIGRGAYTFICPRSLTRGEKVGEAEITDITPAPWRSFRPAFRLEVLNQETGRTYRQTFKSWESAERKVSRMARNWPGCESGR